MPKETKASGTESVTFGLRTARLSLTTNIVRHSVGSCIPTGSFKRDDKSWCLVTTGAT